ncbi:MAG: undecaprenyl-diphosphate phosphatase [Methanopyri archaeon]|nr:undecaprenyl-diphosphate phosphatase [Methanopyri archaeon]
MDVWTAVLAGVVQGVTEWLPISSEGQATMVMMNLLGIKPSEAMDLALWLHSGTLLAVLFRFGRPYWKTVVGIVKGGKWRRLAWFLIAATVVTGVVGVPIYKALKHAFSAAAGDMVQAAIGAALIVTGILLRVAPEGLRDRWSVRLSDALIVGAGQGVSIIPGISRSGTTMALLLWRRFDGGEAVWLSFYLAGPAMLGALVLELKEGMKAAKAMGGEWMLVAIGTSFVVSLLCMEALLRVARRLDFSKVCIVLGSIALVVPLVLDLLG